MVEAGYCKYMNPFGKAAGKARKISGLAILRGRLSEDLFTTA